MMERTDNGYLMPTQEMQDAYVDVAPSGMVSLWGLMAVLRIIERDYCLQPRGHDNKP